MSVIKKVIISGCIAAVIFSLLGVGIFLINDKEQKNKEFDDRLCKHGNPAKWVNACVCDKKQSYSGKYCSEPAGNSCQSNSDCSKNHYCLKKQDTGYCYKNSVRNVHHSETADFALSDSLMNYNNAQNFCDSLGNGYRSVTRADFNCTSDGVSCLDRTTILNLQKTFGNIGFFWLDEKSDSESAYYTDINDGIVYNISKENNLYSQAMCIRKKQ